MAGISLESLHHPAPREGRQGQPAKMFFFRQPNLYPLPGILIRSRFRSEDGADIFSVGSYVCVSPLSMLNALFDENIKKLQNSSPKFLVDCIG